MKSSQYQSPEMLIESAWPAYALLTASPDGDLEDMPGDVFFNNQIP